MNQALAISADGELVAGGHLRGRIKVWGIDDGGLIFTLDGHADRVASVVFGEDATLAISGGYDKKVNVWSLKKESVWDLSENTLTHSMHGHGRDVLSVALSQDQRVAVSGSRGRTLAIWNLEEGVLTHACQAHKRDVSAVAVNADGHHGVWEIRRHDPRVEDRHRA